MLNDRNRPGAAFRLSPRRRCLLGTWNPTIIPTASSSCAHSYSESDGLTDAPVACWRSPRGRHFYCSFYCAARYRGVRTGTAPVRVRRESSGQGHFPVPVGTGCEPDRRTPNPKVGGSNPPPATKDSAVCARPPRFRGPCGAFRRYRPSTDADRLCRDRGGGRRVLTGWRATGRDEVRGPLDAGYGLGPRAEGQRVGARHRRALEQTGLSIDSGI
jgi:hypothetical protein